MIKSSGNYLGMHINEVAEKLVEEVKINNEDVYLDFNGIVIFANKYMNAKDVLDIYNYSYEVSYKAYERRGAYKQFQIENNIRERELNKPVKMFKLSISNEEYQAWKDENKDDYSAYCFKCAEKWAELMEIEIDKGNELSKEIISVASHNPITNDSTGYQMSIALSILWQCWIYGDKLPISICNI